MRQLAIFVRRYAARYWIWYLAGIAALLATNWLAVQIPLRLAEGIDAIRGGERGAVLGAALAIALMGLGVILIRTLSRVLMFTPGRLVEYRLRGDLFAHLLTLPRSFYDRWQVGDIVSRASNDITFVRVFTGFGALGTFNVAAALLLTGTEMVRLSPKLTAMMLGPIVLAVIAVQLGTRRLFTLVKRSQEQLSDLSDHVLASLQGVQTIQGFNAQVAFTDRFTERNQRLLETNLALARIRAFVLPLLGLSGACAVWILLGVGGPMAVSGELSVGELVAFVTFVTYLLHPLRSLGWLISVYQRGLVSCERIFEFLDLPAERPGARQLPAREGGRALALADLSFSYPDGTEALREVTARIPAGSTAGIFGRTGSGKTTLLRLIARVYDPPAGSISADGVDLLELEIGGWRSQLAAVPQVPFLFSESVAENISMGPPDEGRLKAVLSSASLEGDLEHLPQGLDTVVGERGIMLSGGQRQRTALARALYRGAGLLLLDDVLSAVDHHTEQNIIGALERIGEGGARPTVVIVSHRMSVLARCDHVLVLDEGRLVDQGSHDELLARPGLYREAWEHSVGRREVS